MAAAVIAGNAGAWAGAKAVFPGLSLLPPEPVAAAAAVPRAEGAAVVAQRGDALPAEAALDAAVEGLASRPPSALGRWVAATDAGSAMGTPFDFSCGAPEGAAPVLVRSRGWSQVTGPLPADLRESVTASFRAYGAGEGAAAFAALREQVDDCSRVSAGSRQGLGVEAMSASTPRTAAVVFRRGDVLAVLTHQAGGGPGSAALLRALADSADAHLARALEPSCIDQQSDTADAARSPYVNAEGFQGRTLPSEVGVDASFLAALPGRTTEASPPTASASDAALVASSAAPVEQETSGGARADSVERPGDGDIPVLVEALLRSADRPALDVPEAPVLPDRPADPIYPAALPDLLARPQAPTPPTPPATSRTVHEAVADPDGPGCGWAFTGQSAPVFDARTAAADLAADRDSAQQALRDGWAQWITARDTYLGDFERFEQSVGAYAAYVEQVSETAQVWGRVQAERDQYQRALETYEDALRARADFFDEQEAARVRYESALESCAVENDRMDREHEEWRAAESARVAGVQADTERIEAAQEQARQVRQQYEDAVAAEAARAAAAGEFPAPVPVPEPVAIPERTFPLTAADEPTSSMTCPPPVPSVLGEQAPPVGAAPVPPADPTP